MEEESKNLNMTRESELVAKTNWKPLKGFINEIFVTNGYDPVKKFAKEFSDGKLFLLLFNLLFDEKVSFPFHTGPDVEHKIQNWNKINALICFNYLQQAFYLGASTMKTLAMGGSANTLFHIIKLLINESQYVRTLTPELRH